MNARRFIAFFAIVVICLTLNACKKEGTDKNASCRIVTATQVLGSSTYIINITYNNEGKISTLVQTGTANVNKVYTYSGNTIIVNATYAGAFFSRDSITLDNNGKPLNIRQYWDDANTLYTNFALEYSGDKLLKYQETTNVSLTPKTVTLTNTNGNTTKVQSTTDIVNMEYHTDKAIQKGDFLEFSSVLQYGVPLYKNKNLVKTIDFGGSNITNYNYEFNSDGLISKITSTSGASSSTIDYQYQCD